MIFVALWYDQKLLARWEGMNLQLVPDIGGRDMNC